MGIVHIDKVNNRINDSIYNEILSSLKINSGCVIIKISKDTGISRVTVKRYLHFLEKDNKAIFKPLTKTRGIWYYKE